MKNTIIFAPDSEFNYELKDFLELIDFDCFYANSDKEVIKILNHKKIDFVLINSSLYIDFKLIKYINENYKNIKVILALKEELIDLITTIKNAEYKLISKPIRLFELQKHFIGKEKGGQNEIY